MLYTGGAQSAQIRFKGFFFTSYQKVTCIINYSILSVFRTTLTAFLSLNCMEINIYFQIDFGEPARKQYLNPVFRSDGGYCFSKAAFHSVKIKEDLSSFVRSVN